LVYSPKDIMIMESVSIDIRERNSKVP
jgi:hypothetical protein